MKNFREWLSQPMSALFVAIAFVLCVISFGFGTNYAKPSTPHYSHSVVINDQCDGMPIPNPCDPDSNN